MFWSISWMLSYISVSTGGGSFRRRYRFKNSAFWSKPCADTGKGTGKIACIVSNTCQFKFKDLCCRLLTRWYYMSRALNHSMLYF